ncbi:MAG: ADP-ribosylglycohydrolase family protein [Acidimicrobiia bacterium]
MSDQSSPLFTLLNGEGAGAMLAAVAGDVAGGKSPIGYSALSQQATVVAYHVLRNDGVDRALLAEDLLELAADSENPSVYREPSEQFVAWLEASSQGNAAAIAEPSAEPAARVYPVGVWFRRDPVKLVKAAISVARLTHIDASTVVGAAAVAGGVAASSFAQTGRDLILGSAELAELALAELETESYLYSRVEEAQLLPQALREAVVSVGAPGTDLVEKLASGNTPIPSQVAVVAIVLAGSPSGEPYRLIEAAATVGGSEMASMVGAMVGARVGLRLWPWVVPNDTWFAEIGRRLVNGNRETRDIPVPYQVEERLTFGFDSRFA